MMIESPEYPALETWVRQGVFFESFVSDMSGRDDFGILFVRSIWMGTNAPNEYRCVRVKMFPHDDDDCFYYFQK